MKYPLYKTFTSKKIINRKFLVRKGSLCGFFYGGRLVVVVLVEVVVVVVGW
jgi:hypothetical protein